MPKDAVGVFTERVHARIGLLGNPSDGFHGKVISFSLQNFFAEVTISPSASLQFVPHPEHDSLNHHSLHSLAQHMKSTGYSGGVCLLLALCKRFVEHCTSKGIALPPQNFTLSYETNIPRQSGLSGSSAIVCAALNCLLRFYDLQARVPAHERPGLVLSAEQELGITAGLQDRVIQVYGGLMYMDFDEHFMTEHGYGRYQALDPELLPPLWLMYAGNPSDSGKVHSDVKRRWLDGDLVVRELMEEVASLAAQGRQAIEKRNWALLAELMHRNFDLRRRIFGDDVLGELNIKMVELARSVGAEAKFTGSGGAIIVFFPRDDDAQAGALADLCRQRGFSFVRALVSPARLLIDEVGIASM